MEGLRNQRWQRPLSLCVCMSYAMRVRYLYEIRVRCLHAVQVYYRRVVQNRYCHVRYRRVKRVHRVRLWFVDRQL